MIGSTFKKIEGFNKKNIFKIKIQGEFNKIKNINDFNNKFQKKFSLLIDKLKPDFIFLTGDRLLKHFVLVFLLFYQEFP